MSLLHSNRSFQTADFLFIALGLLGFVFFFLSYSSHDPRSSIRTSINLKSDPSPALQILDSLGYATEDFEVVTGFKSNRQLLDSLQQDWGRHEMIQMLSDSTYQGIFPFFWEAEFMLKRSEGQNEDGADVQEDLENLDEPSLSLKLNGKGQWFEFQNHTNRLPTRQLHRPALIYAFKSDSTLKLWRATPDSTWFDVLNFDLEEGYDAGNLEQQDQQNAGHKPPHKFAGEEVKRLGSYYLQKSAWDPANLELTDIRTKTIRSRVSAELRYQTIDPVLGQMASLRLTVLPTGTLLSLNAQYEVANSADEMPQILDLMRIVSIFLAIVLAVFLFYFRIRARVVDTKPALVVGILAGFLIPLTMFMEEMEQASILANSSETLGIVIMLLMMGISSAFASVGFFVAFALGDSITRQHWSEKLVSYDYLRQGMFFNKPIGETLLRSIVLTGILCGLWPTLLYLFPNLFFEVENIFLSHQAAWAPLYLLFDNAWYSLLVITGIFTVLGSQAYAWSQRKWVAFLVMVASTALFAPLTQNLSPYYLEIAVYGLIGLAFAFIYLKWDYLTLLLTHFLFLGFLSSSTGWIIPESPDLPVFVTFAIVFVLLAGAGILFITRGKEQRSLPRYVPEYVEELAQEERIKQELQIARQVQQSFLPVRTPKVEGLDIAAICQPAFETGGDYYDFIQLDDRRIALAIGDVSGKGVPAAFYMTFTKGILHSLCRETKSPAELLKKANRLFVDNARKGTFISLVYGIIDMDEQTFTFSRAGHNPILHLDASADKVSELQPTGIGIGLTRDRVFDNNITEVKLSLSDNDILMLYTDGIVEALNISHDFYGDERLLNLLKSQKDRTSQEILSTLTDDVMDFIGTAKQHDDMTIMVIKLDKAPKGNIS